MNNAREEQIREMIGALQKQLLQKQSPDGMWRGRLSSSAISTSVSVFALSMIDSNKYAAHIRKGTAWLKETMQADGSWGDTVESPSNLTATLLSYASLCAVDSPPLRTKEYLDARFGGSTDRHIIRGVLACYGSDLTFSVPILVMCALAGVVSRWDDIPPLPFELSVLPQRFFRFLQLPVVSYAIPALIAVGILRYRKGKKSLLAPLREMFVRPALNVLEKLQPSNGGFLEAAPLTAFVSMCMSGAGYREHAATQKAAAFLTSTVRDDGSWPIDTDLAGWVTSLSVKALGDDITDRASLAARLRQNAFTCRHPFTGAKPGGWGWSDLPGAVPDADDTAGALIALHILLDGKYTPEAERGIEWLLALQNKDGGMPTFCKGWGKLPFDRSSADISAHAFLAIELWQRVLPVKLQRRCASAGRRLLRWMEREQAADGSWTPLWFGDQDAEDERSLVYGTAVAADYLLSTGHPQAFQMATKGAEYLLSVQNTDGGWGGAASLPSKVTLTARALPAIVVYMGADNEAVGKGVDYLCRMYQAGRINQPEPIGLYFARLWYSEEIYPIAFVLQALKRIETATD